ncbi:MAG: DUF3631 domain-containing protein [Nitrosomonas sp.]|uniref:DUF3631 domain-containing protein n=1 Tax=Nitrosomonas sp. TaxID=42353 RepID=UPI0027509E94|nr:DUF3631 domain-containing protein [Nitrosomonas sp.]MDP3609445.1 DUF3631 domain-containing protein [Methylophilus sp.]MDZ4107347.1 DUF3631 domain-containing protein [Nitrosomonas sp.]
MTTFKGFTGTRPDEEFKDLSWKEISNQICPDKPVVIADKSEAQYFVPCLLKDAPLVGNTLDSAIKNGESTVGKMRSKSHVTKSAMLLMDIDGFSEADFKTGLAKIRADGLTYLAYTTHSYGNPDKPGIRVRLIIPVDCPVCTDDYAAAWHGFDQQYFNGQAGKADSSGANLYQQQGARCSHPDRIRESQSWQHEAGVVSADTLIELGRQVQALQSTEKKLSSQTNGGKNNINSDTSETYPPSNANKIAESCQQIRTFRDYKGAGQNEPLWYDCLGIVGHCQDGPAISQEWSSGHPEYDKGKTAKKLEYRLKTHPTTCSQFRKTNPEGCIGCTQKCSSPIILGWIRDEPKIFEDPAVTHSDSTDVVVELSLSEQNTAGSRPAFPSTDAEVIESLAVMSLMDYDRIRLEKAKELRIQLKTLDDLVKAARNEEKKTNQLLFPEVEPYPEPIDLAQILDEISAIIRCFIVLDTEQADIAALWVAHTYLIDVFEISPIAIINAPEKACAKTLFQTLLIRMCYRPLQAANASASALFRAVESWQPTVFFDESDTFFRDNNELLGIVNAGYKRGGYVLRSESTGDSFEPRAFSVFSAKSIAGILLEKHLPDSTMSRGIVFNMRRKLPHELIDRMRSADCQLFEIIGAKLMRFALDYSQRIRLAQPKLPDELSDREQDNFEALLAIAECAGPEWLHRATAAALNLSNTGEVHTNSGNELLADIRHIFDSGEHPRKISTVDLIKALIADDESPWATYNFGKSITPRQLAKLLTGYGIKSKTVRMGHANTPKGYDADQFSDVFARYLSPKLPHQRNVSSESNSSMADEVSNKTTKLIDF